MIDTRRQTIIRICAIICLIVFTYSTYRIIYWMVSNKRQEKLEEGIFEEIISIIPEETEESEIQIGTQTMPKLILEKKKVVDFNKLYSINQDTIGWICIENTKINYPIVQAKDNEYYLAKDINKQSNSCGSIFLDCNTNSDFSEKHSVIYGHNLKSGGMFANLEKIYNGELGDEVIVEIYAKNKNSRYQVIASYVAEATQEIIRKIPTEDQKVQYIIDAMNKSKTKFKFPSGTVGNIVTLITCHGNKRTVVNAVEI